jgi:hypothetical protein
MTRLLIFPKGNVAATTTGGPMGSVAHVLREAMLNDS